jgi:phage gp29-like protein
VLPNTADIKTVSAGQLGAAPFSDHLEYQDKQIVLAITSGLLTMLAESGSGTLAGGAHSATFDRIVRALAKRISETFQAQFDKPLLEELFPGQACLAWFEISANEEEDTGEYLKNVKTAADAGYRVDPEQIEEKTGMQFVEERKAETGDRKAKPPIATGFNRQPLNFPVSGFSSPVLENRTREEFAGAFREDMSPLTGRLAELLALEGEAFDTAAAALRADLPTLLSEINDDPAAGEMLAEIFGEQFLAGLTPTTQQP